MTLLLPVMPLLVGCNTALDVYESKAAPAVVVSPGTNGALSLISRTPSSDVLLVTGAVQQVDLPFVNSPAVGGDKATCMLLVPADSIPAHPHLRRVALHYDNHGWLQGLSTGMQVVLRFKKNGEFDGLQFPANFIQANGAGNLSQPVRPGTNQAPAAAAQ
jgi:hypothetical protein